MSARQPDKRVRRYRAAPIPLGTFLEDLAFETAADDIALPLLDAEASPPASLKDRLFASIESEHRFAPFEERFAELADLPASVAAVLLGRIDQQAHWAPSGIAGVDIFHFDGGPRVRDAITGFVRMPVGCMFPHHEHAGTESVLVLQGALRDDDGEEFFPGDEIEMDARTSHAFSSVGEAPLLFVTIAMTGITIHGQFIPPGDPRA